MRDLEIWRHLRDRTFSAAELVALSRTTLARRGPYLGLVLGMLSLNLDPERRAAALAVLAGVRGVPGVRAIVAALDDDDATVRQAAIDALAETAREAPYRYSHALFHEREDVRRAALARPGLGSQAHELGVYLRADPACAELAASAPWPSDALAIAIDLYRAGHCSPEDFFGVLWRADVEQARAFLTAERRRSEPIVDAYLGAAQLVPAPMGDHFDTIVDAIQKVPTTNLDRLIQLVGPAKNRVLARRLAVAITSWIAKHGRHVGLASVAIACEPTVIGFTQPGDGTFKTWLNEPTALGLVRYKWPCKPAPEIAMVLLARTKDLAAAAAIAGLVPVKRLAALEDTFGEGNIVAALLARDHGWDQICALPPEHPALEIAWLARLEKLDFQRYVALAGHAMAKFTGKRLDGFVEQLPRRHRQSIFLAALRAHLASPSDRLADVAKVIASRIDRAGLTGLLEALLALELPERGVLVRAVVRETADKLLETAVVPLDDARAILLVDVLADPDDPPPRSRELAVAAAFSTRSAPVVKAWCTQVTKFDAPVWTPPPSMARRALTAEQRGRIMSSSPGSLANALGIALTAPVTGLASALAMVGANPSATACAALMGCADPLPDVARQLDRFCGHGPAWERELDQAVNVWQRATDLPALAHAALYRWEQHTFALVDWIDKQSNVLDALRALEPLGDGLAYRTLWMGISEALMFMRYRDVERFTKLGNVDLAQYCAERVDLPIGRHAARIVVALVEGKLVNVADVRDRVLDRIADADLATREYAARLVRLEGMPAPPAIAREPASADLVETIRKTTDLDALVGWCGHTQPAIVEEAVLQLLVQGERGQLQLALLLDHVRDLPAPLPIVTSVQLWDAESAIAHVRRLAGEAGLPAAWRFYLNVALATRGEAGALERALEAARDTSSEWYFRRSDWDALVKLSNLDTIAIALADAPHHHAYQRAVNHLLAMRSTEAIPALERFLELDADRPIMLRREAAMMLCDHGDPRGMPLIISALFEPDASTKELHGTPLLDAIDGVVDAALIGGPSVVSEKRMWEHVEAAKRRSGVRPLVFPRILEQAATDTARRGAATYAVSQQLGMHRLADVAEVFAWGVRRGVELTGRLLRFHLTSKERDFGHTRLSGDSIFVSPLPMLRGEPNGRDIVEGLVLHEIGHHVYHRGEEPEALWAKAHKEGVGHLLNLVADEHLERNLRAIDAEYGDRLKRLGAYAFQHAPQELAVPVLLNSLRAAAAPALIKTKLDVGFAENAVRLRRGHILAELDRHGHPLARFARAFRLGLGNRMNDPLLAKALELTKGIREMTMPQLYDLTWKLADLFGGAVEVAKVFGGPEGLEEGNHERDDDVFGAGVSDDALQKEIERVLDPRDRPKNTGKKTGGDRLWINVSGEADFNKITTVTRVRGTPEQHRHLVAEVERHADRLRAFLDDLGLRWEPQRARTQGRAIDRQRLLPLVTRNDPRMLIARTPIRRTDLFLGVVIDCSGSMTSRDNITRAKKFAALVADAVEPLPGVEARFFGFTDSTIYDCGTARDCGVSGLVASGGNNDAAGLYHVANEAMASRKKAKVIVMISDGLPTECSVDALRGLVQTLSRRKGIVCAQVAVHALEEICFPNYVLLDGAIEPAIAKFGRMIGSLVQRSLQS
ncbi:MAG: vWA domain-containing protein [Kofleriaceae bacterium]